MSTGMDIVIAKETADQEIGLSKPAEVTSGTVRVPTPAENDQSLALLNAKMASVGGLFT